MTELLLTALILFGATLLSSIFGFGAALFAMPLLTLLLDVQTATPLFALAGLTNSMIIAIVNWRRIDFASAWRLVVATLLGIPVGVLLIKYIPGNLITHLMGVFLVGFGVYRLAKFQLPKLNSSTWAITFGFFAGVLGGAYNTAGPPVVIYGEMSRWSPVKFRATLLSYFSVTATGIVVSHGLAGLWSAEVFQYYSLSVPGILASIAIGSWINHRLTVERFQSLLSVILVILGILLWI